MPDAAPGKMVGLCAPAVAATSELVAVLASVEREPDLCKEAKQSYGGWLGFYNSHLGKVRWDKPQVVAEGTAALFLTLGLTQVPMMARDTLSAASSWVGTSSPSGPHQ